LAFYVWYSNNQRKETAVDRVDTEKRGRPRKECSGIIMFNVLSDDLNIRYGTDSSCIKGIARAVNINDNGMMMSMIDMFGLSDNLQGFSFNKLKGTLIEFCKLEDGKAITTEIVHVSDNNIGVRYL
jgi:hypothetical protein